MNISINETAAKDGVTTLPCYHCALPVAAGTAVLDTERETPRHFCCNGCYCITRLIESGGLGRYYQMRDGVADRPGEEPPPDYAMYDDPNMQAGWVTREQSTATASLLAESIHCAACVWLIERWLDKIDGVNESHVNLENSRVTVRFDESRVTPGRLLRALHQIGYPSRPFTQQNRQRQLLNQRQALLKRLGVSAAFGMQVMVISVALYAGEWFGIEPDIARFLQRANLLLTLPILGYAASPFFRNAWQKLQNRSVSMDTPVSIALALAFAGSVYAVGSGEGDTYFDSVAMFVFFLTGARLLEVNARIRAAEPLNALADVVPNHALKITSEHNVERITAIAVTDVRIDDLLLVKAGDAVPVDGTLVSTAAEFDESLLTGEHLPVQHRQSETVLAGSINLENAVRIRASADPAHSVLQSVLTMADRASETRPWLESLAERVAGWFVAVVLGLTILVAAYGISTGASDWLATSIAVLVVTCPCALSLATPLAMTAAANNLLRQGLFVVNRRAIDTLARIDTILFDKTGTVTDGKLSVTEVRYFDGSDHRRTLTLAAAVEQYASHPVAKAIVQCAQPNLLPTAHDIQLIQGLGVCGVVDGQSVYVGSLNLIETQLGSALNEQAVRDAEEFLNDHPGIAVLVAIDNALMAGIAFSDPVRQGASEFMAWLASQHISTAMLSGDRTEAVTAIAEQVGIADYRGECLPQDKLAKLQSALDNGQVVAMAGDGVNDTPALSRAHVGIAIAPEVNVAAASADLVLTGNRLDTLIGGLKTARKARRIVRQNILWALCYNACAVPAAVAGLVPPWLAGIGMSLSSIVVVVNASRLNRPPRSE